MTDTLLFTHHLGQVHTLDHRGNPDPDSILTEDQARATLTRYRDRARTMDGSGQHMGAELSDRIADELSHSIESARLWREQRRKVA